MTNKWLNSQGIISHSECYIFAIQEQEINTRALQAKRQETNNPDFDKKCRYCHRKTEDIFHLLCSCSYLSASLYLPMRHNEVAKVLYNGIIKSKFIGHPYVFPRPVWKQGHIEIWWDMHIVTTPQVKHNKPDLVVWNSENKKCIVADVAVPLDENVYTQEKSKVDTYAPSFVNLLRLYPEYTYETVPIIIGATGLVTGSLMKHVKILVDSDKYVSKIITEMQRKALIGSMRILKSALSLKQS